LSIQNIFSLKTARTLREQIFSGFGRSEVQQSKTLQAEQRQKMQKFAAWGLCVRFCYG
jgi:hypothetical protein